MATVNLKQFAGEKNIHLITQLEVVVEATDTLAKRYNYTPIEIRQHFDALVSEIEEEAYKVYLKYELIYGQRVLEAFIQELLDSGEITSLTEASTVIGKYFPSFDRFCLSLAQGRKSRAGSTFEKIHNSLFRQLGYPFDEQRVINGKPDFIMPSEEHFFRNAMDCIIFTSKRTLRERWRQIVTEGTRGTGFFLATIDPKITKSQLAEMLKNRVYIVCPQSIRLERYSDIDNVLSFDQFFTDHVEPAIARWKRNGIIK